VAETARIGLHSTGEGEQKLWGGDSLVPRPFINSKKRPGNLSEFKLLTSAALELAVPIGFQNASRDSCGISFVS